MNRRCSIGALAALITVTPVGAQQMTMARADGETLPLGGGRIAVLKRDGAAVAVDGLITSGADAGLDLRRGDRIVMFQEKRVVGLDSLMAAYRELAIGSEIILGVARDGREHTVRFPKVPIDGGRAMAVRGTAAAGAGAGAWVTGGGADAAPGFAIAGTRIRENGEGMPEVSHRESHPAAATVPLRVGDVVTAIDGRSIAALAGLKMFYDRISPGTEVRFSVKRGNETLEVTFPKPDR